MSGVLAGLAFELDGVVFHCRGDGSGGFALSDAAHRARAGDEDAGLEVIARSFLIGLGPQEYARFAGHVARHGTSVETLTGILTELSGQLTAGQGAR